MPLRRTSWRGLELVIENEAGSYREWTRPDGTPARTLLLYTYGYFADHAGSDGDELDCYIGPDLAARFVFVVHQLAPDGSRDEDKCFLDFRDEAAAKAAYLAHRDDGERCYGGMSSIPAEDFIRKLSRRSGDGKIRHEQTMPNAIAMEAPLFQLFEVLPKPGEVRSGVWDRFTTWGPSRKLAVNSEGKLYVAETVFDEKSLGQMVDNFVARGVKVPLDWNHQTAYAKVNGKPAESLARYSILVVVRDGKVIKAGALKGYEEVPVDPADVGIWPSEIGDGLYGFRCEVTPRGQEVLPNLAGISPMFSSEGVDEQDNAIGYVLTAVAATDVPFQGDRGDGVPGITFEAASGGATQPRAESADGGRPVNELYQKMGIAESDTPEQKMQKMAAYAFSATPEELKTMAADCAKMEGEPAKSMAARMTKMAAEPAVAVEEKKQEGEEAPKEMAQFARDLGLDPVGKSSAVLMDAIRAASLPAARVASLVTAQVQEVLSAERAKVDGEAKKRKAAMLMEALPKTYPGDREALGRLAERDPEEALKLAKPFLPPAISPHLFDRVTREGAPIGEPSGEGSRGAREPRPASGGSSQKTKSGAVIFSADDALDQEARKIAESKDPILMERLNALLPTAGDRANPALRMFKAQELAAEMFPELAERADDSEIAAAVFGR